MSRVLLKRLGRLAVTLFAVTALTAFMLELIPGDPALSVIGADYNTTPEQLEQVRADLGLNEPVHIRYLEWTSGLVQGDFGHSFRTRGPVNELLLDRLPVTLQLMVMAQLIAVGAALVLASISAVRQGSALDHVITTGSFALLSMPNFVLGLILILIFAVQLDLLPATGYVAFFDDPLASIRSLVLPAIALGAPLAAIYTRLLRARLVETLDEEFVLLARAKGFRTPYILLRHALRPSSLPLLTLVALDIGTLVGGSIIIERMFAVPGVGRLAIDSILARDYITVQAIVVVVAVGFVLINFIVDLTYMILDPRIRSGR